MWAVYQVMLHACGGSSHPAWLGYKIKAASAEDSIKNAMRQAKEHYPEYERFEVTVIGKAEQ